MTDTHSEIILAHESYQDQMKILSNGNYWAHTANQTCDWPCHYGCDIMDHSPYCPDLAPHHLHLFKTFQKCLAKTFATNTDMKQAVTSWLETLHTDFFHTTT